MDIASLRELFAFSLSPLEIVLRGSAVYWFLFLLLRFVLRRDGGSLGIADILLLVLIADASQNAMAGEYKSIADGFLLVATIAGWNWAVDCGRLALEQRAPLRRAAAGGAGAARPPGAAQPAAREPHQRRGHGLDLREQGIDKLADVKIARMEARRPHQRDPGAARRHMNCLVMFTASRNSAMTHSDDSTLGPSNSSDSGSDCAGAARQPGLPDPLTPVDKAMREDAPRSPLPQEVMSIETDQTGTAELTPEPDPEPDEDRERRRRPRPRRARAGRARAASDAGKVTSGGSPRSRRSVRPICRYVR